MLQAIVPLGGPQNFYSQAELATCCNVDERTVANWEMRGLPVNRELSRPRYPVQDCLVWASEYQLLCVLARLKHQSNPGPEWLSLAEARSGALEREREVLNTPPEQWSVLVPLWHDHPMRRAQLELAAAGLVGPSNCTCGGEACPVHEGSDQGSLIGGRPSL